ncbi:MAG: hypothetical protein A3B86_00595 [Candidatus Yanofskybacteria bacterium RIFCSPHIGHO2_02_FULL_38_22b]|uniref:Uncharacterized protein n=1 Tax=Candidatus Yanofskybacteria bacterium RIFCSPHIGHO2_02_FULL_38_22b TaxID=1802673 RepID=A0A1F8F4H6_9BACT|nr:MAG: hypothetical protein A2816_03670 [Candidatus Yanofskybacteria bacterium RIFCSPHIGHO2_01_FULL_39_44]OGN07578.1 MAG: hypothetical protein A3B86_00595 [Candidatus Yanofskybacteria bacterium RIFCSPHIGHO2_02_FULL_38_22b]OGN20207.1 MAG: hypothetical protein A2910_00130 [Candidatus Yanofskybacteria bacterium RIFCSPLOWO2_01_FULL_39_28]
MVIKPGLFLKELILFIPTFLIGAIIAYRYAPLVEQSSIAPQFSFDGLGLFLVFFAVLILLMKRFRQVNVFAFRFFLLLIIFSGSQIIFGSFVDFPWDVLLAISLVAIFIMARNVFVHDVSIMFGIAGIASILGITISPNMGIALLVILSFYDILAVYWTKHMVQMARGMVESGAILGFVIPFEMGDFFYHKPEAGQKFGEKFMILGSGDIGLPLVFVSSVAATSISRAIIVAVFVVAGLFLTHLIFVNQKERKPMAALPPIATMTIIGYLISLI